MLNSVITNAGREQYVTNITNNIPFSISQIRVSNSHTPAEDFNANMTTANANVWYTSTNEDDHSVVLTSINGSGFGIEATIPSGLPEDNIISEIYLYIPDDTGNNVLFWAGQTESKQYTIDVQYNINIQMELGIPGTPYSVSTEDYVDQHDRSIDAHQNINNIKIFGFDSADSTFKLVDLAFKDITFSGDAEGNLPIGNFINNIMTFNTSSISDNLIDTIVSLTTEAPIATLNTAPIELTVKTPFENIVTKSYQLHGYTLPKNMFDPLLVTDIENSNIILGRIHVDDINSSLATLESDICTLLIDSEAVENVSIEKTDFVQDALTSRYTLTLSVTNFDKGFRELGLGIMKDVKMFSKDTMEEIVIDYAIDDSLLTTNSNIRPGLTRSVTIYLDSLPTFDDYIVQCTMKYHL